MAKKYTIRHSIFGDDYLEDEKGNKIELKRPLFGDPYYEIDGEKLYPEKDGRVLSKRGMLGDEEKYEKREGLCSDYYEEKGWCFITTACVMARGLPDDCEELTILRKFRRDYLEGTPEGISILQEYKKISKKILQQIDKQRNKEDLFHDLYYRLVCGTINLIKQGKVKEAVHYYKSIVKEYEKYATN